MRNFHDASSVAIAITLFYAIPANAYRHLFPTPTFAGLKAAQIGIGVHPTTIPWSPSEILRRLSEDPGICGWVEGNSGTFLQLEVRQRAGVQRLKPTDNTVSCDSGYTCAATSTFIGCCSTGRAGCEALFTTCYDDAGPSCNGACQLNSAALIW